MKNHKYFEEEQWPHYNKLINKKINEYFNSHILKNNGAKVQNLINDCREAHNKYYQEFNWALYYFLVFLCILVVPMIFIGYKLFKMVNEKNKLYEDYITKDQLRIKEIRKLIYNINYIDMINICFKEIHYEHKGPITPNFLKIIQKHFPTYNNDWIFNDKNKNVDSSSWGVFDNRILVVNRSKKICKMSSSLYVLAPSYITSYVPMMLVDRAHQLRFKSFLMQIKVI